MVAQRCWLDNQIMKKTDSSDIHTVIIFAGRFCVMENIFINSWTVKEKQWTLLTFPWFSEADVDIGLT